MDSQKKSYDVLGWGIRCDSMRHLISIHEIARGSSCENTVGERVETMLDDRNAHELSEMLSAGDYFEAFKYVDDIESKDRQYALEYVGGGDYEETAE